MNNKEMVIDILKDHGCQTSVQIKGMIYRKYNKNITPQSVAGIMRPLLAQGYAGKSPDPCTGKMVYWLNDYGKEQLFK